MIQETEVRENGELVQRILKREIDNLAVKQSDWARWDDTYEFITNRNQAYIESNLNDESLRLLGVDIMAFVNNSGEIVYTKQILTNGISEETIPSSLEIYLIDRGALLDFSDPTSIKSGLLTTAEATFMISSQPITTSDGRGDKRGTIVFARYLTENYNELLSSLSGYSIRIAPYDTHRASEGGGDMAKKLSIPGALYIEYNEKKVASYQLLKNIFDNPSLLLRVEQPASIIVQGESFLWRNLWYSFFILIVYVSVLVIAIDLFLLRRIENMRQIARKVAVMQAGTVPDGDIDDFSYLATVMVSALKKVGQSDSIILGNRNEMEKFKMVIDQSLDHIIITDPEGKVLYANKAAEKMTGYSLEEMFGNTPGLWGRQMSSEFYRQLWDTIRLRKEVFEGEVTNKRKDGTRYKVFARITPILDEKRRVLYFIGNEHPLGRG